jgi:uncharacterized membrane protein YkoI
MNTPLAIALLVVSLSGCRSPAAPAASAPGTPVPVSMPASTAREAPAMITRTEAIEIAQKHIAGRVTISPDATLEVAETERSFVVEWRRHIDFPGPDYDARVTIDKATGAITGFLVGG